MESKKMNRLTLFMIPIGVAVNFIGGQIAILLRLPLYLDGIGTIVVGAVCGWLPGVLVGLISNILNSISAPTTLFYAPCSILFGLVAAWLSKKGYFKSFGKTLLTAIPFALIGGGLGACLTWVIFKFDFGTITASGFALVLYEATHWGKFICELIAELGMDLLDKVATVIIVFFVLKALPNRLLSKLPLGHIYAKEEE